MTLYHSHLKDILTPKGGQMVGPGHVVSAEYSPEQETGDPDTKINSCTYLSDLKSLIQHHLISISFSGFGGRIISYRTMT